MIGSSSACTSSNSSPMPNVVAFSGIRPASIRVMSRMSLISASRWRAFESMRDRLLRCGSVTWPGDVVQQHVRVAQDRVERRPELVRHVGEELRLQRRRLLERDVLPAQQLVLLGELGGRFLHLALELDRRLLQLLVEARLLDRLGEVVQDRDDPHQLALLRQDRAGDRLDRQRPAGQRIAELDLAAVALLARSRQHVRDERRQVRAVGAHAPQRHLVVDARAR